MYFFIFESCRKVYQTDKGPGPPEGPRATPDLPCEISNDGVNKLSAKRRATRDIFSPPVGEEVGAATRSLHAAQLGRGARRRLIIIRGE